MNGEGDERRSPAHRQGRFIVAATDAEQRLDAFVARATGTSVAAARRLVAEGFVRVNDRAATKGARVSPGAWVDIAPGPSESGAALQGEDPARLAVLYEDAHLVAIDKAAGMPSHAIRPGERGTLANMIVARYPECAAASPDPREGGLVHRLDTATSGVLIAARSREAWRMLREALVGDGCEKRYLCEVHGQPPESGRVDAEIGRRGRRGSTVRVGGGGRGALPAETTWVVLARHGDTTLIEARLHAGRAHQVRAHMAAAGFPILGDDRYGRPLDGASAVATSPDQGGDRALPVASGLRLHAWSVRIRDPWSGVERLFRAPAPVWAEVARSGS